MGVPSSRVAALLGASEGAGVASLIRKVAHVSLPARVPPWTETGLTPRRGDHVTILASGEVVWRAAGGLAAGPRYHLWARIGDGDIFRIGSDTRTIVAYDTGPLRLCVYYGAWAARDGTLKSADGYASLDGGLEALAIHWAGDSASRGLEVLAKLAPDEPLLHAERTRLAAGRMPPPGFEPHWLVGDGDIACAATIDGAPAIALRVEASAGITRHPLDVALTPGTFLEWTWRVNTLPSPGREDTFASHDYTSIALEFDDGRDLTWYWSAAIPVEEHYDCPLPRWAGIETHLVVRSGSQGLGTWLDERRDVHADVARALGRVPARIAAVWLIGVCLFQGGTASTDVRRIALVQEGRTRTVFPA